MTTLKKQKAKRRKARVRAKIKGTSKRPRLSVFRSLSHLYVQFIDDEQGRTLLAQGDQAGKGTKTERAALLGGQLAKKVVALGIKEIVFDRGAKKYHGRVRALAEALRQGGLKF